MQHLKLKNNFSTRSLLLLFLGALLSCAPSTAPSPPSLTPTKKKLPAHHTEGKSAAVPSAGISAYMDGNANEALSLTKDASLNEYVLYAVRSNATLKAAYQHYLAALEKAPQVSALPDPHLSYAHFLEQVETRVGPQEHKLGLMQPIPWFGKLSLQGDIADLEARAALYAFLAAKNKLIEQVTSACLELAYLARATEITEANFELLKRWEQVVTQRYRAQTGTQANLIKVQVELGKLEDKLQELSDLRTPLLARLNALLNRPSSTPAEIGITMLETQLSDGKRLLEQKELENQMADHNPEMLLLAAMIEARKKGIELAHKNFYPDLGIGVDYVFVGEREMAGRESGDDALVAMFSMTLPLYRSKYEAGLTQAKQQKQSSIEMKRAKSFELSAQLAKAIFNSRDSDRRKHLFQNTLVPKAEESLTSNYTAFEAGKSSFLDLLDAERILLDFKLSLARAQADQRISQAALSALLGDYSDAGKVSNNGAQP